MIKNVAMAAIAAAGLSAVAQAQIDYTFELRLIPDGAAGAPSGAWAQYPHSATATRIGFWVQARVMQDSGENWGIGRFTAPPSPNCDFITVTDSAGGTTLQRGQINTSTTNPRHGRSLPYTNGGLNIGATGNDAGSAAFPGVTNNENGAFDSGNTRLYGMDAYVGGTRTSPTGVFDVNTGNPVNPWGVNGATPSFPDPDNATAANPVPTGEWSPWASLYRIWVVPTITNGQRGITLTVSGQLNGTVQAAPSATGGSNWAMQLGAGETMSTTYTFNYGIVPTPGAAALVGMGVLVAGRRRR